MTENFFEKEKELKKTLKKMSKMQKKLPKKFLREQLTRYMHDFFMLSLHVKALEEYMVAEGDYAEHISEFIHKFEEKT